MTLAQLGAVLCFARYSVKSFAQHNLGFLWGVGLHYSLYMSITSLLLHITCVCGVGRCLCGGGVCVHYPAAIKHNVCVWEGGGNASIILQLLHITSVGGYLLVFNGPLS